MLDEDIAALECSFQATEHDARALADASEQFLTSQGEILTFLQTYAEIDLAGVRFPNPFIRGVRFSLATGLHVLAAHERRHLWQAWRVRRTAEQRERTSQMR